MTSGGNRMYVKLTFAWIRRHLQLARCLSCDLDVEEEMVQIFVVAYKEG